MLSNSHTLKLQGDVIVEVLVKGLIPDMIMEYKHLDFTASSQYIYI